MNETARGFCQCMEPCVYTIDLCATSFGLCKCGLPKWQHGSMTPRRTAASAAPKSPETTQQTRAHESLKSNLTPSVALAQVMLSPATDGRRIPASRTPATPLAASDTAVANSPAPVATFQHIQALQVLTGRNLKECKDALNNHNCDLDAAAKSLAGSAAAADAAAAALGSADVSVDPPSRFSPTAVLPAVLSRWRVAARARSEHQGRAAMLTRRALAHHRDKTAVSIAAYADVHAQQRAHQRARQRAMVHGLRDWRAAAQARADDQRLRYLRIGLALELNVRLECHVSWRVWTRALVGLRADTSVWRVAVHYWKRTQLVRALCSCAVNLVHMRRAQLLDASSQIRRRLECLRGWQMGTRSAASDTQPLRLVRDVTLTTARLRALRRWRASAVLLARVRDASEGPASHSALAARAALAHDTGVKARAYRYWAVYRHRAVLLRLAHYCACVRASRWAWGRWIGWVSSRRGERHGIASLMRAAPSVPTTAPSVLARPFARLHRRLHRERASAWQHGRAPFFVLARVRSLERSLRRAWRQWALGASTHARAVVKALERSLRRAWRQWALGASTHTRAVVGALRTHRTRLAAAWHHWGPLAVALGSSSQWWWRKVRATLEGSLSDWRARAAVRSASQARLACASARWVRVSQERSIRRSVGRLAAWVSRAARQQSLWACVERWRERGARKALLTWGVAVQAAAERRCHAHVATRAREGRMILTARAAIRAWAMGVKLGVIWSGPAKAALLATALVHARHVDTARATQLWRLACAAHFQIEERRVVLSKVEDACREAREHRELQRLQLNAQRALSRWLKFAERRLRFTTWRRLQTRFAPVAKSRQPRHALLRDDISLQPRHALLRDDISLRPPASPTRRPTRPPAPPTAPPAPPIARDGVPLMPSCAQYDATPAEVLRATLDQLRLDLYHPRAWDTDGVYNPRARVAQQLAALGCLEGLRCPNY